MKQTRLATIEIDHAKLVDYLLNIDHPKDGSKARFFLGRGFLRSEPKQLADALFEHLSAKTSVVLGKAHPEGYGMSQVATGPMAMPNGTTREVLSVWLAHHGGENITFVTAYPSPRKSRSPC